MWRLPTRSKLLCAAVLYVLSASCFAQTQLKLLASVNGGLSSYNQQRLLTAFTSSLAKKNISLLPPPNSIPGPANLDACETPAAFVQAFAEGKSAFLTFDYTRAADHFSKALETLESLAPRCDCTSYYLKGYAHLGLSHFLAGNAEGVHKALDPLLYANPGYPFIEEELTPKISSAIKALKAEPPQGNAADLLIELGVPGISVQLFGAQKGKTDAKGKLTLRGLPPGMYYLAASKKDYQSLFSLFSVSEQGGLVRDRLRPYRLKDKLVPLEDNHPLRIKYFKSIAQSLQTSHLLMLEFGMEAGAYVSKAQVFTATNGNFSRVHSVILGNGLKDIDKSVAELADAVASAVPHF